MKVTLFTVVVSYIMIISHSKQESIGYFDDLQQCSSTILV